MSSVLNKKIWLTFLFILMVVIFYDGSFVQAAEKDIQRFEGEGTKEDPYKIYSRDDLVLLRRKVNQGEIFVNRYFEQQCNIDMENKNFIPIGSKEGTVFYGVYNGNGYYLENVKVKTEGFAAIFGRLGGVVANLGIENGKLKGETAGGIAGYMMGANSAIFNCYNKASIAGNRAGGIAGFCGEGTVAGCWNVGKVKGAEKGGIIATGGDAKIYRCYSTTKELFAPRVVSKTSWSISKSKLYSSNIAKKLNVATALMQYMFAKKSGILLKQWKLSEDGELVHSDARGYIIAAGFVNYYLLPLLLIIGIVVFSVIYKSYDAERRVALRKKYCGTFALLAAVVALFLDTALIHYKFQYINFGNGLFILLVHLLFASSFIAWKRDMNTKTTVLSIKAFCKKHWAVLFVIGIVVILELQQFDLVPKFDANLYYGSLLNAVKSFRLDLITYIGAFVCWKWIHGLALLIMPFEFLLPGKVIGVYVANVIITIVTIGCLYWLLRQCFVKLTPFVAAICCGLFMFFPYSMGLFTYLCMDWHLPFFIIWLMVAAKKKNNLMISFCGYLLSFTKITGMVFYVFFLLIIGLREMWMQKERNLVKKVIRWWSFKRVILWITPVFIFLTAFLYGENITIQNFQGTYVAGQMIDMNSRHIINTSLQTFVFGLRWLIVFIFLIAIIVCSLRKQWKNVFTEEGKVLVGATIGAAVFVFGLLCIYNSDADCPRYTAIFNVIFVLMIAFSLKQLVWNKRMQQIVGVALLGLFIVQTYWTIDPAIINIGESFDTGETTLYKLALPNDTRAGMNIGTHMQGGSVLGDIHAYNYQAFYYDELLEEMLTDIQPDGTIPFYILDVYEYEFYLSGNINKTYKIYWNTVENKRTYTAHNPDCVYLYEYNIESNVIAGIPVGELSLPDEFHLIVTARIDEQVAIRRLKQEGYEVSDVRAYNNKDGALRVYDVSR